VKDSDCELLSNITGSKWCKVGPHYCLRSEVSPGKTRIDCCLGKLAGAWWCGNQSCPVSPSCTDVLTSECAKPENLKLPACQQWCNKLGTSSCDSAASKYCGTPDEPGEGANDPFCYCYQSPYPLAAACFDGKCARMGYKNAAMKTQMIHCPRLCGAITVCDPGEDCVLDGNRYEIYCGELSILDYIKAWIKGNPILTGIGLVLLLILLTIIIGNLPGKSK